MHFEIIKRDWLAREGMFRLPYGETYKEKQGEKEGDANTYEVRTPAIIERDSKLSHLIHEYKSAWVPDEGMAPLTILPHKCAPPSFSGAKRIVREWERAETHKKMKELAKNYLTG
ncbi:MAG: hypothetical protein ACXQS2_06405, partial [Methermicoccaceae archaeon]